MRWFQWPGRAKAIQQSRIQPSFFYAMWDAVAGFAKEIRTSDFMSEMIRRRDAYGSEGVMGARLRHTLRTNPLAPPGRRSRIGRFIGMS